MANVSKTDLIDLVALNEGVTKTDSKRIVQSFLDSIKDEVLKGNTVTIVGFGSWTKSERTARKGRNPQTGAEIDIPAKEIVKHKVRF